MVFMPTPPRSALSATSPAQVRHKAPQFRHIFPVACFGITNLHKMTFATASPVLFFASFAFHVLKFDMTVTIISTLQH